MNTKRKWVVNVLGEFPYDYEISVVVEGSHGQISYGWFDEDKLFVAYASEDTDNGFNDHPLAETVFNRHKALAEELCQLMNERGL